MLPPLPAAALGRRRLRDQFALPPGSTRERHAGMKTTTNRSQPREPGQLSQARVHRGTAPHVWPTLLAFFQSMAKRPDPPTEDSGPGLATCTLSPAADDISRK